MPQDYLRQVREQDQTVNRLFRAMGVRVEGISQEAATLGLAVREDFLQGAGVLAGGVMATLLDEAMAHVVIANLQPGETTATVEMSVRYFKPVRLGEELKATATLVKRGKTIIAAEATLANGAGELAAKASASFIVTLRRGKQGA